MNPQIDLTDLSGEERELFALLLDQQGLNDFSKDSLPSPKRETAPLSITQERLWLTGQFAAGSAYGNLDGAFRIQGPLRPDLVRRSIEEIVARHEILRTTFPNVGDNPVQKIHPTGELAFCELDFQAEGLAAAVQRAEVELRRAFETAEEPPLRVLLMRLGNEDHLLVIVTHQLLTDGWGMRVFLRELTELYCAFSEGKASPLAPLTFQYADFAVWQRDWPAGKQIEEQMAYWKAQLENAPQELELPLDRPRPVAPTFRSRAHFFEFSESLSEKVRALSRREGVTLFTTLLAGFQALLHCYSRQRDILVGTTVSSRGRSEFEALVGNCGNNLLLRLNVSDNPTARVLLARAWDMLLGAQAHQDFPLELLAERLQKERRGVILPAFQVLFILRDSSLEKNLALPGTRVGPVALDVGAAGLDLKLDLVDGSERLSGLLEYKTDLFDAATISRSIEDYQWVLERMGDNPEVPLSEMAEKIGPKRAASVALNGNGQANEFSTAESKRAVGRTSASENGRANPRLVLPRTELEETIVKVWKDVLQVEEVGAEENFFDLGGRSVHVTLVSNRLKELLNRPVPIMKMFEHPTVRSIANYLGRDATSAPPVKAELDRAAARRALRGRRN